MLTKLSKYFSLFLILFLVNSNYSFALTHLMCKMNNTNKACECEQNSQSGELQFDSKDPGCCKTEIKEINNTNTLESSKISIVKEISFKSIQFLEETNFQSFTYSSSQLHLNHFHPPSDIPILFSHILI